MPQTASSYYQGPCSLLYSNTRYIMNLPNSVIFCSSKLDCNSGECDFDAHVTKTIKCELIHAWAWVNWYLLDSKKLHKFKSDRLLYKPPLESAINRVFLFLNNPFKKRKTLFTVQILCIGTDRSQQTVQTKIRLLLKKQSDQGLRCLPFHQHLLGALMQCYINILGQLWQLFEVSQILEFLRYGWIIDWFLYMWLLWKDTLQSYDWIPYLFGYKTGFHLSRMTTNNLISSM